MKKLISLLVTFLALPALAATEVTLGGNVNVQLGKTKPSGGSETKVENYLTDLFLKAGYTFDIYHVGLLVDVRSQRNGGSASTNNVGLILGYRRHGWFADLSLIPVATTEISGGIKYEGGFSWGLDIGHRWQIVENVHFGWFLYYRNLNFSKEKTGGTSTSGSYQFTTITHGVAVTYTF